MRKKRCIAMLLAGGQGSRLGILTKSMAKPAVPFGGQYRIIDFPLSNCANSGIDTVGVLTQYRPLQLNSYIGTGESWDLDRNEGGVYVLPPYMTGETGVWYKGTANAIYQNIPFIEQYDPDYVLILSGDHIYKMNYNKMLSWHIKNKADVTIAVRSVPWEVANQFGIMATAEDGSITEFAEKPKEPKSNKASMGVYVFSWPVLRKYLTDDEANPASHNDFGKDIIPKLLSDGKRLMAYAFEDYWKDVGTVHSLWEANMDLLKEPSEFNLYDHDWPISGRNPVMVPQYIGSTASVTDSMITDGCIVNGTVSGSVLYYGVTVEEGAEVIDSVVMSGTVLKSGSRVVRSIVAEDCVVNAGALVGGEGGIALIGTGTVIPEGACVEAGVQADNATFEKEARA